MSETEQFLPPSVNYNSVFPTLPDNTQSFSTASVPINGSTFTPSSIIQVDLVRRGFLVPDSVYIRYKAVVASATTPSEMIGTPVYTPFLRLETSAGSQMIDNIPQYNQTANMLVNLTTDVASKYGLQSGYGFGSINGASPAMSAMDGKKIVGSGETYFVSAPLPCLLTSCEKLIPLFAMPTIRFQFTMDSLANMFAVLGGVTGITISNFEICYTVIDMGTEVERMVLSKGNFMIKSQSFFNVAYPVASGITGSLSLPFSANFASIKSIFMNFSGTAGTSFNKWGDSFDITNNNGDYSWTIGGQQFPQRTLSTTLNKAGILQELRKAVGSIYGSTNSLSINSIEFGRIGTDSTTSDEPAKFWLGISTEKYTGSHALLTGISSGNSPIMFNFSANIALTQAYNINMIINYDALIEIDVENQQVNVKK
jgi:hypothetical protein